MTQAELAERCDVTQQAVGLWEKGKSYPDLASILRLSQVFLTTTDYLLTGQLSLSGKKVGPVSPEEAQVLARYRELSPEGKTAINSMLKALQAPPSGQAKATPLDDKVRARV